MTFLRESAKRLVIVRDWGDLSRFEHPVDDLSVRSTGGKPEGCDKVGASPAVSTNVTTGLGIVMNPASNRQSVCVMAEHDVPLCSVHDWARYGPYRLICAGLSIDFKEAGGPSSAL